MILALLIAVLMAGGTYLVMMRGMVRIVLGMSLITHAANLLILSTGVGAWRAEPVLNGVDPAQAADPLPQAFVLTAIVISMATTACMLALSGLGRSDDALKLSDKELVKTELDLRGRRAGRRILDVPEETQAQGQTQGQAQATEGKK